MKLAEIFHKSTETLQPRINNLRNTLPRTYILQHQQSLGGKCGICGDPYDAPRENEAGGKYAKGIIVAQYAIGNAKHTTNSANIYLSKGFH